MPRQLLFLSFSLGLGLTLVTTARAVDSCKVAEDSKTGVLRVSAKNVTGIPKWGFGAGHETKAFANQGTCLVDGTATKCELGAPGSPDAIVPPDLCTLYLADDGTTDCSAHIKGCTPGVRDVSGLEADMDALQAAEAQQDASIAALQANGGSADVSGRVSDSTAFVTNSGVSTTITTYAQSVVSGGVIDTGGALCVPTAGSYFIHGQTGWAPNGNGLRSLQIIVNGFAKAASVGMPGSSIAGANDQALSTRYPLNANDCVQLVALQTSGIGLAIGPATFGLAKMP